MAVRRTNVSGDGSGAVALSAITLRRAEILREFADGYTQREIAARLGISVNGVRSHVEDLRDITGSASVRGLGRWWRDHRLEWAFRACMLAGVDPSPLLPGDGTAGSQLRW